MSAKKPAPKQKPKGPRKATGKATVPEQRPVQRRYKSAAEVLEDLLPALEPFVAVGRTTRGKGPDGWKSVYLETMRHCANVSISSKVAGVTRQAAQAARTTDPDFAAAEKQAIEAGIDLVEASAFKSAVYGDLKPVYHQGILCGEVLEYSDAMRAMLLKGRRPEVYRDKLEQSGTLNVVNTHLTRAEFKRRLEEARVNANESSHGT